MDHERGGIRGCPDYDHELYRDHIFFIGFMGAGKSSVARKLSEMFKRDVFDTDALAKRIAGLSIPEIFGQQGEAQFRRYEYGALTKLLDKKSAFVSCGGGIVERADCVNLMRAMGYVVYLDIDLDGALSHITNFEDRPLLKRDRRANEELLTRRTIMYEAAADMILDIKNKTLDEVAYLAAEKLWEANRL